MSRQHTGNVMSSSAALQGANMAFNAHALDRETKKNNVARPQTATVPELSPLRHAVKPEPEPEPISEMPEAGLVMSRIKAYSGSSTLHAGQEVLGRHSPQLQAAQLAALRSSSRTPSVVRSSPSVSPLRRARTGAGYTKRDDIVPTPKPEFLSARASNAVHAPAPVRRESTVASSLANIVDQDGLDKHLQARESVGVHASASESDANSSEILLSKDGDLASRSQITKTKPEPPARKPNLSQPPRDTRKQPEILPRLRDEQGQRATKINSPGPKKASDTSFERETSPSHSTNTISSRPETDEIVVRRSYNPYPTRQITGNTDGCSGMTKEGLADAIIASSLASSRAPSAPSPYSNPPPLPPPRRSRSRSGLHPGDIFKRDNRSTPSPPKRQGLRQTLRDPPKPESEDNKNPGRRHLIRHHPHKHHEGDRKRWRQEVSEAARKRYEGVWAANKGLWVPPEGVIYRMFPDLPRGVVLSDLVVHLVVRDIWSRSRLPDHTLELIWNLVDRKGIGLLSREEFVVGLWLIDEALRGHKIPVKVPDSVWASVRGLLGIKHPQEVRSSRSRTTFHPKNPAPAGLVTKEPDHEHLTSDHVYFRHTE